MTQTPSDTHMPPPTIPDTSQTVPNYFTVRRILDGYYGNHWGSQTVEFSSHSNIKSAAVGLHKPRGGSQRQAIVCGMHVLYKGA